MQHVAPTFDMVRSIKTTQVLGEILDVQLREAAWCAMARLRQGADPTASLTALRRWESNLCGNMAGLASAMSTRLVVRLSKLLQAPQDLVTEAFVAAVLLLRCDRARSEAVVFAAWQNAACPELRDTLAQGIIHGGLVDAAHLEALVDLLGSEAAPLRQSAGRIIAARRLPVHGAIQAISARRVACPDTARMVLDLMAEGAWPLDAAPVAQALASGDADLVHGAERVLLCHGLLSLSQRARLQLRRGDDPSLLGLEALALTLLAPGVDTTADLQLLAAAAQRGRLGPLVAHALGLCGLDDGARLLLQLLYQHDGPRGGPSPRGPLQEAAIEGFTAITGIEARAPSAHGPEFSGAAVATELAAAWGPPAPGAREAQRPARVQIYGRAPSAHALVQAMPHMQVGRWQSLRRLLLARSAGAARLSGWALVQQQLMELDGLGRLVQQACGPQAQGLVPSSFTHALHHAGALG